MAMHDSVSYSTLSAPPFLTTLNALDLESIQDAFHVAEKETGYGFVTKCQFCDILGAVLAKGTKTDYLELFDLVDISRDGMINWDKFSNHLLLEYYEKEDRMKTTQVPQWHDLRQVTNPHKNFICQIMLTTYPNRYCTVSKDGLVCLLDDDFEIKRMCQVHTNPEEIRSKDLWITDAVLMPNINKIAFSTTSKEIWIYDMLSKNEFICQYKIYGMKFIPLCITYWSNQNILSQSLMAFGDTDGNLHTIFFTAANVSLFEKPLKSENSQDSCFPVSIHDIADGKVPTASYLRYHGHTAWVRQIQFIPLLDCFVSCSTTSTDSVILAWLGKARKNVRLTAFKIPLGISGFDYQEKLNLLATAGINNHVCLWNPYVVSKPVGILRGHMTVIVAVQFIHSKYQLISLSKDKILRVWDVNLQICLQKLTGVFPKRQLDVSIFMFFDQDRSSLFTSFNHELLALTMKTEVKDRIVSHESPVTDVIYNEKYGQVISVCEGSCITIWFLNNGQKVKYIPHAHGDSEITVVTLDHSGTRILTAGTDGNIKIWDINGNCHHVLVAENGNPCEISQILYLKRSIVAVGWSKVLCCFPTNQMKSYYLYPVDWKGKQQHFDDILTAKFLEPKCLVTASYDGDIVFWNTNTQNSTRKIVTDKKPKRTGLLPSLVFVSRTSLLSRYRRNRTISRDQCVSPRIDLSPGRSSSSSPLSPRVDSADESDRSSSQNQTQVTITSISFLTKRNNLDPRTADFYSCHSNGKIKFWNSLTCEKLGEFQAFDGFGSVVSCVDSENKYLGIGCENGTCKLFSIETYLLNQLKTLEFSPVDGEYSYPGLVSSFTSHSDAITSIVFVEKKGMLFTITASSDCSVALHCYGQLIGTFGQQDRWNINDKDMMNFARASFVTEDESELHEEESLQTKESTKLQIDGLLAVSPGETRVSEEKASSDNNVGLQTLTIHIPVHVTAVEVEQDIEEVWNKTVLGKTYQEERKAKRDRKQPYELNSISTKISNDKQTRSYRCLETKEMEDVNSLEKPEFVVRPEKYFREKEEDQFVEVHELVDELKLWHDEKSIFPKYILDMEMKMKTVHKIAGTSRQHVFSRLSMQNHSISSRGSMTKKTIV